MVWTWMDSTPFTRCCSNRDTAKRLYSLSMISCESHKYWLILGRIFLQPVEMGSYELSAWIWFVSCCYSSLLSAVVIGHYICSVLHSSFWRTYYISQINKAIPGPDEKCTQNNGQGPIWEVHSMWILDHQKEPQVLVWWFYWPDNRASVDANVYSTRRSSTWSWYYNEYTSQRCPFPTTNRSCMWFVTVILWCGFLDKWPTLRPAGNHNNTWWQTHCHLLQLLHFPPTMVLIIMMAWSAFQQGLWPLSVPVQIVQ